jgi:hypothetical protein
MSALEWFVDSLMPATRAELAREANFEELERMIQLSGFVDWRYLEADLPDTTRGEEEES